MLTWEQFQSANPGFEKLPAGAVIRSVKDIVAPDAAVSWTVKGSQGAAVTGPEHLAFLTSMGATRDVVASRPEPGKVPWKTLQDGQNYAVVLADNSFSGGDVRAPRADGTVEVISGESRRKLYDFCSYAVEGARPLSIFEGPAASSGWVLPAIGLASVVIGAAFGVSAYGALKMWLEERTAAVAAGAHYAAEVQRVRLTLEANEVQRIRAAQQSLNAYALRMATFRQTGVMPPVSQLENQVVTPTPVGPIQQFNRTKYDGTNRSGSPASLAMVAAVGALGVVGGVVGGAALFAKAQARARERSVRRLLEGQ